MASPGGNSWLNGCVYFMLGLLLLMALRPVSEPTAGGLTDPGEPPVTDRPGTGGTPPNEDGPFERPAHGRRPPITEGNRETILYRRPLARAFEEMPCGLPSYFADREELARTLGSPTNGGWWWGGGLVTTGGFGSSGSSMSSYSNTNNQVDGVDEPDRVKTDGQLIYLVSQGVRIIRAYPPEVSGIIGQVSLPGWTYGIFVNGPRLVVLWRSDVQLDRYYYEPRVHLHVYDLTTPEAPVLDRNITLSARYLNARMIGDHVYLIAQSYAYTWNGTLMLPTIWDDGERRELEATDIAYFSDSPGSRLFALVLGVDIRHGGPPGFDAFLAAPSTQVYVSGRNVYLAGYAYGVGSTIHKVAIAATRVCYVATGHVPGSILNQFSMDEYGTFLRVATTTWAWPNMTSNLYVLNRTMVRVGGLEGLAPGETIHSARFLGERAYLVTFRKTDPFFVIDVSSPTEPKVLGFLKIDGYSDYMHPYDRDHIIGLGKDTIPDPSGRFSWFQGLKLSLFDATDVENPSELSKLVIGDRGTSSSSLFDHHAFLFLRSQDLLVIPVDLYLIDRTANPSPAPSTYGKLAWMGAYVISVTLEGGFQVVGRVGHLEDPSSCYNVWPYGCSRYSVIRSLYIEDVLYTISGTMIRMNDLTTLEDRGRILL